MSRIKHWGAAVGVTAIVAAAAAATYQYATSGSAAGNSGDNSETANQISSFPPARAISDDNSGGNASTPASAEDAQQKRGTFIVVLKDEPLASYKGTVPGIAEPERKFSLDGKGRLDVAGSESQEYVGYLQTRQAQVETQMSTMMGRDVNPRLNMQHAINAMVVDLSEAEAKAVRGMPNVRFVEAYREYTLDTDNSMPLIGAPPVWNGTNAGSGGLQYRGEGTVLGVIDSGINFGSPSFAAVGPIDGYTHINPLGAGNYLGTCAPGGVDAGRCNSKLIGGYDFVCGPPVNGCTAANTREEPGFGDTNSHGSHVASTVAGNLRDAVFSGANVRISGVAPRANIIAYDVCVTNTASGVGSCPNTATLAAVNRAVADGVVTAINYSISGGEEPWADSSVSLAFLGAVDAGIFVATSAGNAGPSAATVGHLEPWVASSAAAQHGRGGFAAPLTVTGPAPVPANLSPLILTQGVGGVTFSANIPGTTPLRISSGINTTNDGCAAYPANTFAGAIAVIRRGTCTFTIKTNNAAAAGAVAVIIANNQAGVVAPSVPGTTIPVFGVTQAEGDALRNFGQASPTTATAQIGYPLLRLPNVADALAAFSSRGPALNFSILKPDVTAPGVDVLAVTAGTTITGSEQSVGLLSGTSMASPHTAGAAMLIRQARPTWTPPEIKSALAMTANTQVYTEDTVTLANPFARGSGRIQVDRAINAGLVMHEVRANYLAADPAIGGDPATLNQPNLTNRSCFPTCVFNRTFRNTRATTESWRVQVEGIRGAFPSVITLGPNASITARFSIYGSLLSNNGNFSFGSVVLTSIPTDGSQPQVLRLPIAVAVQPPVISMPASVPMSMPNTATNSALFNIGNTGGSSLTYNFVSTGTAPGPFAKTIGDVTGAGLRSTAYLSSDTANTSGFQAQYAADDFVLTQNTRISTLFVEGFNFVYPPLTTTAQSLRWSIYPDLNGVPAGNPSTAAAAAVWTYSGTPTSAGVFTYTSGDGNNDILLNLATAGQNVNLPPGRYWLVVNASSTLANRWFWYQSNQGSGANGYATINVTTAGAGAWAASTGAPGLSMQVNVEVPCSASWMGGTYAPSGSLTRGASRSALTVLYGAGLTPSTYSGHVCVQSNDPAYPRLATPVALTITP
jgi:subtilisin family serine protease